MNDIVHCHAGAAYPEHPIEIFWEYAWLKVERVIEQELNPGQYRFIVRVEDRRFFELVYVIDKNEWFVGLYPTGIDAGRPNRK